MDIPNNCDCTICRNMCKTPCIPTPKDVKKLYDNAWIQIKSSN